MNKIKQWLSRLSFRTGVTVLALCVPCYIVSFVPVMPHVSRWTGVALLSAYGKWLWWVVWFGAAKTFQYSGITILGVEGYRRLKRALKLRKSTPRQG